jgi:hypothetical protein
LVAHVHPKEDLENLYQIVVEQVDFFLHLILKAIRDQLIQASVAL